MQNVLVMGLARGAAFAKIAAASRQLRLVGVIDPDESKLQEVANSCGLSRAQAFADFNSAVASQAADILVVATPTHLHPAHVTAGLRAGLHVLCEKPLATCRADALLMRQESQRCSRQLAVVQNYRYGSHFRKCKELIDRGEIGLLNRVEFNFRHWRSSKSLKHPHALLFNHGVHHVDLLRFVTDAVLREIHAVEWDPPDPGEAGGGGRLLRLTVMTEARFIVCYDASYADAGSPSATLRISGARGTLEAYGDFEDPQLWLSRNAKACEEEIRERIVVEPSDWSDIDRQLLEGFAQAIERGERVETDIEDNLQTLEWLFRAAEVIERGTPREGST
jgi:predicted dehydrogenase